ncbi:MAG: hypothetical protein EOP80_15705 [Variovorax sp.]|nr:MAG: hypothetical protein EOP80_15705 [Variovorax sp.]
MSCHPNRRLLLGLSAGLLAAGALPAWSRTRIDSRWLQVEVQDRDSGETLPVYAAADGQRYLPGRPGARYGVTLRNLRRERVLVVMAVDGINVLTGETAGWAQNGYVLGPLQSAQIAGWRKSDREIAAFEFTASGESYGARTGRPLDLGVIGIAVFTERRPEPRPLPAPPVARAAPRQDEANAAKSEASAEAASKLGTGHGQREESVVTHTRFDRARSTPDEVIALRYDSRANLVRMGVIPVPDDRVARPRAFPQNPEAGYVPDPPSRW